MTDLLVRSGQPAAQDFLNRPILDEGLTFFWGAFWDLLTADGISFPTLDAYANRYRIDDIDEFDRFKKLMRIMNNRYVELKLSENKKTPVEEE